MNESQVRQWLETQYGGIKGPFDVGDSATTLAAQEKDGMSPVVFLTHGQIIKVLQFLKDGPTFAEIVSAFGSPESVSGSWQGPERTVYSMGLDYPKLGMTAYMNAEASRDVSTNDGRLGAQMKESYRADIVECYAPRASMEEVVRNGYPSDPKSVAAILNRRKPWAGFGAWVPLEP